MTTLMRTRQRKPTMQTSRKILLHSCPRCSGDLFHDEYEEEFVCLQCGRRTGLNMVTTIQPVAAAPEFETALPRAA